MKNSLSGTSLIREKKEQEKWRLLPKCSDIQIFNNLLEHEFLPLKDIKAGQQKALQNLLNFCAVHVPYYQKLFEENNIARFSLNELENLQKVPMLTKSQVQENTNDLRPNVLPRHESVGWVIKTSGTTGHPLEVLQSRRSGFFFSFLKQRELRWFRYDPKLIMAAIRSSHDLPPKPDGSLIECGETSYIPCWYSVGSFFETGPFYGFGWTNPLAAQKEWLSRISPAYLMGQSADLEHLALSYAGEKTPASLKGIFAISQELTEDMEQRIQETFNVPVQVNYGLKEVGIVASRCPEGGRYHVHAEHCFVEIVDEAGHHCRPGQRGRILVTTLNNLVMPLLRYDTDDLAEVVDGPCPCGRTLPSFGRIHGRYRRLAALPPGTLNFLSAIIGAIDDIPKDIIRFLRQYQLHQFKDGSFELSIVASSAMPQIFREKINEKWQTVESAENHPLNIREVNSIPRPQGGKFQKFTSDFMPIGQFNKVNN